MEKNGKISYSVSSLDPEHLQRIQSVEQGLKGYYNLNARSLNMFSLFNSFNIYLVVRTARFQQEEFLIGLGPAE